MNRQVAFRFVGFILSLILTLIAYLIMTNQEGLYFHAKTAVVIILVLAFLQSLVQLVFFIDVWNEKGTFWNLGIFISTISIIFIVVFFSIWIMNHLNYNMML